MLPDEAPPPISVRRWPTERPLLVLNALASAALWFVFFRSPEWLPYIAGWGGIVCLLHIMSVASIRGSAVRVGPDQFPELHARVEELARRIGLRRTPEVYVMQQDGALNAFATRFARRHMIVLLSDLLEACGENTAARDMIIGHELGHIRAGHLRGWWLLMPGSYVPFLGAALSQAREYTCDRYGCAAAGDREGALLGLAILSAGGKYGPLVNRSALVRQRHALGGAWMTVGAWLASHPPLSKRIWALAPDLDAQVSVPRQIVRRLPQAAFAAVVVIAVGAAAVNAYLPRFSGANALREAADAEADADLERQVARDLAQLQTFIEADRKRGRPLPWDTWELYERWEAAHPDGTGLRDPFSGYWYDYEWRGTSYRVWSVGSDGRNHTADDIILDSTSGATPHRRYVSRRDKMRDSASR